MSAGMAAVTASEETVYTRYSPDSGAANTANTTCGYLTINLTVYSPGPVLAWSPSVAAVMVATVAAQRTRSEQAREEYSSELAGESGDTAALLHSPHTSHSFGI